MPELSPQLELFLRIAVGLVGVPIVWGIFCSLIDMLVYSERVETDTDNVQVAAYLDTADVRERFGRR
jgi:hypothetical protein